MSDVEQRIQANQSPLNPTDMGMMVKRGEMGDPRQQSVRQYLEQVGINVDGPVSQLVEFAEREMPKANPLEKMKRIAGGAPPPGMGAGPPPGGPGMGGPPPGGPPGLRGLLGK